MTAISVDQWSAIRQRALESARKHGPRLDGNLYNGGTILVLLCTSAAAFLYPADLGSWSFVPAALSGLAAFLVAMERALNFGARWRYQLAQQAGYEHVVDQIDFLAAAGPRPPRQRALGV